MTIARNLKQDVTWWAASPDGYGGYTYSSPQTIKGRWQDKQELFRTPAGDEQVSKAIVYLDQDVDVGDYLYEGLSTAADPTSLEAYQVRQFGKVPDLRNLQSLRKAIL